MGHHWAPANSPWAHLERAAHGAAEAGALPARRSSSHPPACCSGPEIHLRSASAGWSPIAENDTDKGEAVVGGGPISWPLGTGSPGVLAVTSSPSLPQTQSGALKPDPSGQPVLISAPCLTDNGPPLPGFQVGSGADQMKRPSWPVRRPANVFP